MTRRDALSELARDAFGPLAEVNIEKPGRRWLAEVWCGRRFEVSVERATRPKASRALADVLRGEIALRTGRAA